MMNLLERFS